MEGELFYYRSHAVSTEGKASMILKKRLEWTPGAGSEGVRAAKTGPKAGAGRRVLAFSRLSSHEGLSLGAPHFSGGEVSFYELDDAVEAIEAKAGLSFEDSFILYEEEKMAEGVECIAQSCFLPLLVSYDIEYAKDGTEALIEPVLKLYSLRPATVCASLKVDAYELLPSARIPLAEGFNIVNLRPVKLVRPRKYWAKTGSGPTLYRMELEFLHGATKPVVDVRDLEVWGAQS